MAVATAPIALDKPQVAYGPIEAPRSTPRWGPPIWAADEPIAAPERPPDAQVDVMMLALMLSYRSE